MDRSPLQLALREMHAVITSRYQRIAMILATLLLGVSGPFGTFEHFNLGQRFAYWACMVAASYLAGQGAMTYFIAVLRPLIGQKWPRAILAGLLASLPVAIVVLLVNGIAYQHMEIAQGLTLWLYAIIVTLVVVVTLVMVDDLMAEKRPAALPAPAETGSGATSAPAPTPPPILERVPLPQRGRLVALTVEDHYVDIVTDKGKTLVLMRLADAIREAGGVEGLQIHRSHWVAIAAVIRTHRTEGRLSLELSNGMRLPVSRSYLPAVKAAGLV